MENAMDRDGAGFATPQVRQVETSQPLAWLSRGWADLQRSAGPSLGYGAWVAIFGVALLAVAWRYTYLVPALVGGFLLVAPFVAIVFYALSRQIEQGQKVDGSAAVFAWRRNFGSIALWGLVLTLALILWERVAAIIFALFYGGEIRDLNTLASDVLFSGRYVSAAVRLLRSRRLVRADSVRLWCRHGAAAARP